MHARIYVPARNAMQSGMTSSDNWILEYAPSSRKTRDPLMGWTGSSGTSNQIKLRFASKEAAIEYAKSNNIPYQVSETTSRKRKPNIRRLGYAENFLPTRKLPWTH